MALPWPLRVLLLAGLLGLGALAIVLGGTALGRVAGGIGGAFGDAFGGFFPSGAPSASTTSALIGAPRLDPPMSAYTQLPSVDVSGLLPSGVAGTDDVLHVYVGGTLAASQRVPTTNDFRVVGVALAAGANVITATISTPAGDSGPSAPISITFDNVAPPLAFSSPKNGASVTSATVTVKGTTQAGSTVTIRDVSTAGSTSTVAGANGAFSASITLAEGSNALIVTAADPAGNRTTKTLTVVRGSGAVKVTLTLAWYSLSNKRLPRALAATVVVDDATGHPTTAAATATFTISAPGQATIVSGVPPVALLQGTATWSATIAQLVGNAATALPQSGLVTVVVALADGRSVSATAAFTITK
jgi:hypothetical protein